MCALNSNKGRRVTLVGTNSGTGSERLWRDGRIDERNMCEPNNF